MQQGYGRDLMGTRTADIVTPEAVAMNLAVAGIGSRLLAGLIDGLIVGSVTLVLFIVLMIVGFAGLGEAALIVGLIAVFILGFGYYPLFESIWRGQTPGKRVLKLRVVMANGQPLTTPAVWIRNLVRIVDMLPAYYAIGVVSMFVSRHAQRLGDHAAGTIVVHEVAPVAPVVLSFTQNPARDSLASSLDTSRITEQDYSVIRTFLDRRFTLDANARTQLAGQIASGFIPKVPGTTPEQPPELVLEAIAEAVRRRST